MSDQRLRDLERAASMGDEVATCALRAERLRASAAPDSSVLRVLSLGAGVQSSALALMMAAGEVEPVEFAVFADTQNEPKSVYRWLDWLRGKLPFPIETVTRGKLSDHVLTLVKNRKDGLLYQRGGVPAFVPSTAQPGKWAPMARHCTRDFKIDPIRRLVRARMKALRRKRVVQLMGISLDEVERIKPSGRRYIEHAYPLVDLRITRRGCLDWMRLHNFPDPPKSACSFCPYHNDAEWQRIKTQEPEAFAEAVAFEDAWVNLNLNPNLAAPLAAGPRLHSSGRPLATVDFAAEMRKVPGERSRKRQRNLFKNECEGLCGV
jgi:hypothetical protein